MGANLHSTNKPINRFYYCALNMEIEGTCKFMRWVSTDTCRGCGPSLLVNSVLIYYVDFVY